MCNPSLLLDNLPNVNVLSNESAASSDGKLSSGECYSALNSLSKGKSPAAMVYQ